MLELGPGLICCSPAKREYIPTINNNISLDSVLNIWKDYTNLVIQSDLHYLWFLRPKLSTSNLYENTVRPTLSVVSEAKT